MAKHRGRGISAIEYPTGMNQNGDPSQAWIKIKPDGRVDVFSGTSDIGNGSKTIQSQIVAETLGVPYDWITYDNSNTDSSPVCTGTFASRATFVAGKAVEKAALSARQKLLEIASKELEIAPEDLEVVDGEVRPAGSPSRGIAIADLAKKVLSFGSPYEPIEGYAGVAQTSRAPSAAAHLVHVRVDRETGAVTLLRQVIAQDVGRVLNPALVEGQMLGGTAQGIGWALYEELAHDEFGQLRTGSFVDYAIPSVGAMPPVDLEIVEVPAPDGPFGAKGIGEAPVIAAAAAVANAIAAATGVRMRELPMTPGRVWAALGNGAG